ncbi:dephospho-CoA kinase [Roseicyclus sp. F158]|uniref:Dephospho-CoA kinase n=1 Tax=Tropicimonas omnivorans TaxID=3075590 RepID=A0ABU3DEC6_9RHOB|nr:dephospho-CoA kinase [Roseicyclus sp. F158]MDT0681477.1 dephospho-CoA kinase [Roseicyclus sp. F158]
MSRPFRIGLTGSIGMGKSTTAGMFAEEGVAVWDADAAVHRLYGRDGAAVVPMKELRPDAIVDGAVSRERLKLWIAGDDAALGRIEAVVHPLVAEDRNRFAREATAPVLLFDIPLLFENGSDRWMDLTVCVSTSVREQRRRVLEREGMTAAAFERILSKQMPDAEKRARADRIIDTTTLDSARAGVREVMKDVETRLA